MTEMRLHLLEQLVVLIGCGVVGGILILHSDYSDFSFFDFSAESFFIGFSILVFMLITFAPFLWFLRLSQKIHALKVGSRFSKATLLINLVLVATCGVIYYLAAQSIQGDSSSTAALVFAVLPVYIGLIGSLFFLPVWAIAKRRARTNTQ